MVLKDASGFYWSPHHLVSAVHEATAPYAQQAENYLHVVYMSLCSLASTNIIGLHMPIDPVSIFQCHILQEATMGHVMSSIKLQIR